MSRLIEYLAMAYPIRIVVADRRMRSRRNVSALLEARPELRIVGQAIDGQQALWGVEARCPDVVVIDAQLPKVDGLTATRVIKRRWPKIRVVLMVSDGACRDAAPAGADACLAKGCATDELLDAIVGGPWSREKQPSREQIGVPGETFSIQSLSYVR